MAQRFYITTPIYYVNDVPHLGHAYTTVIGDAFTRYHKMRGDRARYQTGTDEHGQKIDREAVKRSMHPQAFVDEVSTSFRDAWPKLLIEPDLFVRTTDPAHKRRAQELWSACQDAGDIHLGNYEGLYCVACETYYAENELIDGKICKTHKTPVETKAEPTYLFRLDKYVKQLIDLYEREPNRVLPEARRNEVLGQLRSWEGELSVSRSNFTWGIPVPKDPQHVMYVWFDALSNYLTFLGDKGDELRTNFWPPDVHLVGKDIIKFHCVFWPAFLLSAGFSEAELPRTVFAHGFLTVNGHKMTKSIRESVVPPGRLVDSFGADEVRYYLLREIAFGQDGDFSIPALIARIRAELSGTLGNLLNRALPFIAKQFDGKIPASEELTDVDKALRTRAEEIVKESEECWAQFAPHRAMELAMNLCIAGNKYFDENAPWKLKAPEQKARLATVLYHVLEVVRIAGLLLWPAMPNKMNALRVQLGLGPLQPKVGEELWPSSFGGLPVGTVVQPGEPLFRNITKDDEKALLAAFVTTEKEEPPAKEKSVEEKPVESKPVESKKPEEKPVGLINYGDFEKVELKLGHVKTAEKIPKKDKLLKLTVDLGEEQPRTIVAGIALAYTAEQLVGKQIVVVANLEPREVVKGHVSHGMLLACGPSDSLSVVTIEKPMPAGTRVK